MKSSKPVVKNVLVWLENSIEKLKGCFLCTDWGIFNGANLNETTEVITDYVNFCMDNVVTKKQVIIYLNNKVYIAQIGFNPKSANM